MDSRIVLNMNMGRTMQVLQAEPNVDLSISYAMANHVAEGRSSPFLNHSHRGLCLE